MQTALIGLGSNLGDRQATLLHAAERLATLDGVESLQLSTLHETEPIGGPEQQPPYLNAALRFSTSLAPEELLRALQRIEQEAGRVRQTHWGARTLDLDLLLFDDVVSHTPALLLPHRLLPFRRFVLAPAVEIAADMQHPTLGWSVRQCYEHLLQAPPRFEIWSVAEAPAQQLLAACRAMYPELQCVVRCWERHDLVPWEAAPAPKARFMFETLPVKLVWQNSIVPYAQDLIKLLITLERFVRRPYLALSPDLDLATNELVAAVKAMQ